MQGEENMGEDRRLFGTDGVRGIANLELTPTLAFDLARAGGTVLGAATAVIGRDTRRSGAMLSAALHAGFNSIGVDTIDAGVIPVGGVSALVPELGAQAGVMVSASHNPAPDNGIKFFDARGFKLSDERESRIEARLADLNPYPVPYAEKVGTRRDVDNAAARYLRLLRVGAEYRFNGIEVVVDAAHGAAHQAGAELLESLGATVELHFAEPTGMNINDGCGATHPEAVAALARGRIGLCFDGDADRLIAIDEDGEPANGDVVMAIIAHHLHTAGKLKGGMVVSTVMSNLGFRQSMRRAGIEVVETQVGDRYVLGAMVERGAILGGEQSGHVIFLDRGTTGDGLLTAVRLLEVVAASGKELRELRKEVITEFPQVLTNVRVQDKDRLSSAAEIWDAVADAEAELGDDGRVLIRASGTEPLVRVMVEASSIDVAERMAAELSAVTVDALS
jgi:phosphoglucosamine mutase